MATDFLTLWTKLNELKACTKTSQLSFSNTFGVPYVTRFKLAKLLIHKH